VNLICYYEPFQILSRVDLNSTRKDGDTLPDSERRR